MTSHAAAKEPLKPVVLSITEAHRIATRNYPEKNWYNALKDEGYVIVLADSHVRESRNVAIEKALAFYASMADHPREVVIATVVDQDRGKRANDALLTLPVVEGDAS